MSTIRSLCLGVSAHQKLDHLQGLVRLLGYESLAVFGDCFDEVRSPAHPAVCVPWCPASAGGGCASFPIGERGQTAPLACMSGLFTHCGGGSA